jgi:type I restriction enzyme S subunit
LESEADQEAYWLLNLDQVESQSGRVLAKVRTSKEEMGSSIHAFGNKHVLYSKLRPNLNKVVVPDEAGYCTSELVPLLPNPKKLDRKYLAYYLRSDDFVSWAVSKTAGAKMPRLNMKLFGQHEIPLPPLETQKHISRMLEQADQLRKQAQQMESELNQLAQSLLLAMFGDPVTNTKGWEKFPVRHFVAEFEGGKSVAAAGDETDQSQYRVLKISAVTWREFNPLESKPLPEEYQPEERHFVRKGDLLFSRANTTELVGATSYVFDDYENLLLPDKLWRFVWKDGVKVSPMFIWYLFMNPGIRVELGKLSSGSGGSMKNISKGRLLPYEVIFPPYDVQQLFERKYLEIRNREQACREQVNEFESMFNALMQRAFNGELTAPGSKAA